MTERTTPPLHLAHRKIAINMPEELFERIKHRAARAGVPFTVQAVDLLRCGLLDVEDSERHEPPMTHQKETTP